MDVRSHRIGSARWWSVALMAGMLAVTIQQITQPDYNTNRRALPSEYLWYVIPGLVLVGIVTWRIWRCRVETTTAGITVVRTTTSDSVPWDQLAGFEVRKTLNGGGWRLVARRTDAKVTTLASAPGKGDKAKARVEALRDALEHDRAELAGA